jgi:hypothetical protein
MIADLSHEFVFYPSAKHRADVLRLDLDELFEPRVHELWLAVRHPVGVVEIRNLFSVKMLAFESKHTTHIDVVMDQLSTRACKRCVENHHVMQTKCSIIVRIEQRKAESKNLLKICGNQLLIDLVDQMCVGNFSCCTKVQFLHYLDCYI